MYPRTKLIPDGEATVFEGQYSTDVVKDKALGYLDDGLNGDKPFFVGIAPIGPHSSIPHDAIRGPDLKMEIPVSHPRHAHLFADEVAPRVESFNYDTPLGVSWVKQLPKLVSGWISTTLMPERDQHRVHRRILSGTLAGFASRGRAGRASCC